MGEDQSLPVQVKRIGAYTAAENQSASCREGFHQKMHLRIVPERLIMAYSFDRRQNRFTVHYPAVIYLDIHIEAILDEGFKHLYLYFAHEPCVDLPVLFVPDYAERRVFLLQLTQQRQSGLCIDALRKPDTVVQHRFEHRNIATLLDAERLPGKGRGKPQHRTNIACRDRTDLFKACTAV